MATKQSWDVFLWVVGNDGQLKPHDSPWLHDPNPALFNAYFNLVVDEPGVRLWVIRPEKFNPGGSAFAWLFVRKEA